MKLGLEVLLSDPAKLAELKQKRVALLANPASVDKNLNHAVDLLFNAGVSLTCLFGPQHGMKGDKQDNMIETYDELDAVYKIPTFSLYGKVRRPTREMLEPFDILLVDLQDVGCRIYTYLTTLIYLLEDFSETGHQIWVLDRPNPAGRPVEGTYLDDSYHSFVGACPLPMRHGLTLGEAANWYQELKGLSVDLKVVPMQDYDVNSASPWGWPKELSWVNPSPNLSTMTSTRIFCGSVLIEGTHLSEGRGTTRALEVLGAPMIEPEKLISHMQLHFDQTLDGCKLRACYFEPTFQKHHGKLCAGFQVHVDDPVYEEELFQPYRLFAAALRSVHELYPDFEIFKQPPYEYEEKLLPIEILSGSSYLKDWVLSDQSYDSFDQTLKAHEAKWLQERKPYLLY